MALEDFLPVFDLLLEGAYQGLRAGHREADEDQYGHAEALEADVGMKAADDAEFLEAVDTLSHGGGGEANAAT